jgi:hypothetical protein
MGFYEDNLNAVKQATDFNPKTNTVNPVKASAITKNAADTFKNGTPENAQYKAEMADYSYQAEQFFAGQKRDQAQIVQNLQDVKDAKDNYSASFGDKLDAMLKTAYGTSTAAKTINRAVMSAYEPNDTTDTEFSKSNSFDYRYNQLVQEGLPTTTANLQLLSEAKNRDNFDFYLQSIKTDTEFERSSRLLSQGMEKSAMIAGAFSDPTYLMYPPAKLFQTLQGATRLVAFMGTDAAMQFALANARDVGSPERDTMDTVTDMALAGLANTFFGMRQLNKIDESLTHDLGSTVVDTANAVHVNSILKPEKYDFSTNYNWSTVKQELSPAEMYRARVANEATTTLDRAATMDFSRDNLQQIIKDFKEANKPQLVPQELKLTPEMRMAKEAEAAKEIKDFQVAKEAELTGKIEASGLTKDAFMEVYNNLNKDVPELKDIIRNTSGNVTAQKSLIDDILPIIDHIGKVSPEAKASLQAEIEKVLDLNTKASKVVTKSERELAFQKGKPSFNQKTKVFDNLIKGSFDKVKKSFKEVTDYKALKPLSEGGALTAKELKYLEDTRTAIKSLEEKLSMAKTEKSVQVIHEKLLKLDNSESNLLSKTDEFNARRKNSVEFSLSKQKELYQRMASAMDELMHEANQQFRNVFLDTFASPIEKKLFTEKLTKDLSSVFGQEITVIEKDGNLMIKGNIEFKIKGDYAYLGKNKIMLATLLAIGGSSAAMADDGSVLSLSNVMLLPFILAMGAVGFNAFKEVNGFKGIINETAKKVKGIQDLAIFQSSDKGKALTELRKSVVDIANIGAINSMAYVMKKGSQLSKDLAQRLGFDAVNAQKTLDAMRARTIAVRNDVENFTIAEDTNYKDWLKETNQKESVISPLLSGGMETELREKFLNEVTDHIEFGKSTSDAVKKQAKVFSDIMYANAKRAVENKIIGFTDGVINKISNYVPRIPNYTNVHEIVVSGGKEQLIEQIANCIAAPKGVPVEDMYDLAEKLVNGYASVEFRGVSNIARIDDIIKAMKKAGFDTTDIDSKEVAATLRNNNDAISRGKFRIEMDLSKFKPFTVTIGGEEKLINLNNIYERNAGIINQAHSSNINGMIALKRATRGMEINGEIIHDGIESEWGVRNLISHEIDRDTQSILTSYLDYIMGYALYDVNSAGSKFVNNLRNLSYAYLVPTQFNMVSEMATMTQHMLESSSAFKEGMNHYTNILRRMFGQDVNTTALAKEFHGLLGYGSSGARREESIKNIDGIYNVSEETGHTPIDKVSNFTKYITLKMSGLMHADDAIKDVASIFNGERVAKFVEGKITMSPNRLERYGIDQNFIDMFKGKIPLDKNGNLVEGFSNGWSQDMRDAYANVVGRMVMTDSPEAVLSSLPHGAVTSDAGRLLYFMTSFTAQSWTTKVLAGMKYPDMRSFAETNVYFLGTYAGLYAKDQLSGKTKKKTQSDLIYQSLMMMPIGAPYAIASMVSDPMAATIIPDTFKKFDRAGKYLIQ